MCRECVCEKVKERELKKEGRERERVKERERKKERDRMVGERERQKQQRSRFFPLGFKFNPPCRPTPKINIHNNKNLLNFEMRLSLWHRY